MEKIPGFEYKKTVEQIKNLRWENLDQNELGQLMHLSYAAAREFAESLRIALELYPEDNELQKMAAGELNTTNLSFEDYTGPGDHADYLAHFLKSTEVDLSSAAAEHAQQYVTDCKELDKNVRALSIFSREHELSGIFERILEAEGWDTPELKAFHFYLSRHIAIDSGAGGHSELTDKFEINDDVNDFYKARLKMYRCLPALFE